MTLTIVRREHGAGAICAEILAELPEWFGIPASNEAYRQLAEAGPVRLAMEDGEAIGLMILKPQGAHALENYLLAVRRERRHAGVGRALIETAVVEALREQRRFLTVKTLGPSVDYAPYAETRSFYAAVGFYPLEEFTEMWGPENPCLFMVRPLA